MGTSVKTRIINKHATEITWTNNSSFIPKQAELIVYDADDNYTYERVKIGDGIHAVTELPFIDSFIHLDLESINNKIDNIEDELSVPPNWNDLTNKPFEDLGDLIIADENISVMQGIRLQSPLISLDTENFRSGKEYSISLTTSEGNSLQTEYLGTAFESQGSVLATLRIYYATVLNRDLGVTVNGTYYNVSCTSTGGWQAVGGTPVEVQVELTYAENSIVFSRGDTTEFAPNLDRFEVVINGEIQVYEFEDGTTQGTTVMDSTEGGQLVGNVGGANLGTVTCIVPASIYNTTILEAVDDSGVVIVTIIKNYMNQGPAIVFNEELFTSGDIYAVKVFIPDGNIKTLDEKFIPDTIQRIGEDIILNSSTEGSNKKFKIFIDDSGTISATEYLG